MRGFDYYNSRRFRRFGLAAAGLTVALVPLTANADGMINSGAVNSWMNMVSASQAAQPHWMTPLVTVTPRLEQELRWDFYDQQNGSGTRAVDDVPRGTMDEVSSHVRLDLPFRLTARPLQRLLHLILEIP